MAGSKTETAIRYPEAADQKRRIRNTTQDRKWAARMQERAQTAPERSSNATSWPVEQLLETTMDEAGNPVPDPAQFTDGTTARKVNVPEPDPGQDMVAAMNEIP
jgi:hypothetical protein